MGILKKKPLDADGNPFGTMADPPLASLKVEMKNYPLDADGQNYGSPVVSAFYDSYSQEQILLQAKSLLPMSWEVHVKTTQYGNDFIVPLMQIKAVCHHGHSLFINVDQFASAIDMYERLNLLCIMKLKEYMLPVNPYVQTITVSQWQDTPEKIYPADKTYSASVGLSHVKTYNTLSALFPTSNERVSCPVVGCTNIAVVLSTVVHLNDMHEWNRETQIADWLESLDIDLNIKLPEEGNDAEAANEGK